MTHSNSILRHLAACALVALSGTGCSHAIKYNLDTVGVARGSRLASTLDVETLADQRAKVPQNRIALQSPQSTTVNGVDMCVNSEKRYDEGTVARQVSTMIQSHLEKRGRFQQVLLDQKQATDYHLTGTLKSFYGAQEQSGPAKVGAMFGAIGAIATANLKSPGVIRIELTELKLLRKDGSVVAQLPDISEVVKDDLPVDAYCAMIYFTVDEHLRTAVDKLSQAVEREVEQAIAKPAATTASR